MDTTIGLFLAPAQLENLIATGTLTSCEPKLRIDSIDSSFVGERLNAAGRIFDVADENGNIKTKAKLSGSFITTFGKPDSRMLAGLGFSDDIERFKAQYAAFWMDNFPEESLSDATELYVSIWEHIP